MRDKGRGNVVRSSPEGFFPQRCKIFKYFRIEKKEKVEYTGERRNNQKKMILSRWETAISIVLVEDLVLDKVRDPS